MHSHVKSVAGRHPGRGTGAAAGILRVSGNVFASGCVIRCNHSRQEGMR
jgi:hypothetical protein